MRCFALKNNNKNNNSKPIVIGHRGAKFYALENTVNSIKKAVVLKSDMIELDIRLTKDNIPIIIHDKKINRTTDGKGRVSKLTLKEIKKFNTNGEKVPTLNQVLRTFKKQIFNLDIKEYKAVLPALKIIYKNNAEERIKICSRRAKVLQLVKHFNPQIETAMVYQFPFRRVMKLANELGMQAIHPNHYFATKRLIKRAHKNNLRVNAWTVNNKNKIQKLINKEIDGIVTDDPALANSVKNGK